MELVFTAWMAYRGDFEDFVKQDPSRWLFISWVFRQELLFTVATKMLLLYDNGKYVVDLPIPQPILGNSQPRNPYLANYWLTMSQTKLTISANTSLTHFSGIFTISNKIFSRVKPAAQRPAPVCCSVL
jgi:hypothetical protein